MYNFILPRNYLFGDFYQLAWRDSFGTFDWMKALPVPELVLNQVKQLLALA